MRGIVFLRGSALFVFAGWFTVCTTYGGGLHINGGNKTCLVEFDSSLTQGQFKELVQEFGAIGAFKQVASADPLGKFSFDVGLDIASTPIDDKRAKWNNTFTHPDATHDLFNISFIKLRGRIGLTKNLDTGLFYMTVPEGNVSFLGTDLKYTFHNDYFASAVRTHYTKLFETHDMDLDTVGVDLSTSKRWGNFSPYVGIGEIVTYDRENSPKVQLSNETDYRVHGFAGVIGKFSWLVVGLEADVGAVATYSLTLSYRYTRSQKGV